MAKYSDIKGFTVQTLSTDTVASQFAGGTWASGGALNTARAAVGSSTSGSQTASLAFGGQASDPALSDNTEQYNGTSWTEVADLNQIRAGLTGVGTTTAAAAAMGDSREIPSAPNVYYTQHEQWNGSSWTENTEVNAGRSFAFSFGTAPAFLVVGGYGTPGFTAKATAEEWNGSGWTEVADLNTARVGLGGAGTTTAGIAAGGPSGQTEQWDGSSWTEVGDFSTGRGAGMCVGSTYTDALAFGGSPVPGGKGVLTEVWNGSSWTELNDLSTGRDYFGGSGTTTSALAFGGNPGYKSDTEEWTTTPAADFTQINLGQVYYNSGSNAFKVTEQPVPGGSWAASGSLNTARASNSGAGTQTAALSFGGTSPRTAVTETYNGSTWTEVNDLNTARNELGGSGTQTSALAVAGATAPGITAITETWNGSSWTEVNDLNSARGGLVQSIGTQTANLVAGGDESTANTAKTESWNGSSWTEVNDLNTGRSILAEIGTQTAGTVAGGNIYPTPGYQAVHEQWDGTSWTETADLNTARSRVIGSGVQTSAIVYGGEVSGGGTTVNTEVWNGSAWTEVNNMATARYSGSSTPAGGSAAALFAGGYTGTAFTGATEEFTAPVTNKTITVS